MLVFNAFNSVINFKNRIFSFSRGDGDICSFIFNTIANMIKIKYCTHTVRIVVFTKFYAHRQICTVFCTLYTQYIVHCVQCTLFMFVCSVVHTVYIVYMLTEKVTRIKTLIYRQFHNYTIVHKCTIVHFAQYCTYILYRGSF